MVKRSMDPTPFNMIAAHPEVAPWLGFIDPTAIDLSRDVLNPQNFCFLTAEEDGGYIVRRHAAGLYSAHTLALPSARGRKMLKLAHDCFDCLFTASEAVEIVTTVPDGNTNALAWANAVHFRPTFKRAKEFRLMGELVDSQFFTMTYAEWVAKSGLAKELGRVFHVKLDATRGFSTHADEEIHDRWVGATLGCAIEQNLGKGIGLYNRFAVVAGYKPANVLSEHPPTIDIGDAVVQLLSGAMDVLQIREAAAIP